MSTNTKDRWLVSIEFAWTAGTLPLPVGNKQIAALGRHLDRAYEGDAVAAEQGLIARVIVPLDSVVRTADQALRAGKRYIDNALEGAGLSGLTPVRVEYINATTFHAELGTWGMDKLVGSSELTDVLGVSRQRLHELRQRPDFPKPLSELAATPVWMRSTIDGFVAGWHRRPGPVPAVRDVDMDGVLATGRSMPNQDGLK
jgi:hypothetical protein